MSSYSLAHDKNMADGRRMARELHGILLVFQIHGSVREFDVSKLLTVLMSAMLLLTTASTLTDYIMMYCTEFAGKYTILKYQPSQDFGTFRANLRKMRKLLGQKFDPYNHKPVPIADILNEAAGTGVVPSGENLLMILNKFEQRLNRLDGIDEYNAVASVYGSAKVDKGAQFVKDFENNYLKNRMGMEKGDAPDREPLLSGDGSARTPRIPSASE